MTIGNAVENLTTHVPLDPSRSPAQRWPDRMGTACPYFFRHTALSWTGTLASSSLLASGPSSESLPQPVAMHSSVWLWVSLRWGRHTVLILLYSARFTALDSFIKARKREARHWFWVSLVDVLYTIFLLCFIMARVLGIEIHSLKLVHNFSPSRYGDSLWPAAIL